MVKFNKQEAEHELKQMSMSHKFALKMALIICWTVMSSIMALGICFGARSVEALTFLIGITIILGIISFSTTRSSCL